MLPMDINRSAHLPSMVNTTGFARHAGDGGGTEGN